MPPCQRYARFSLCPRVRDRCCRVLMMRDKMKAIILLTLAAGMANVRADIDVWCIMAARYEAGLYLGHYYSVVAPAIARPGDRQRP